MKINDKVVSYCSECYKETNHTVKCVNSLLGSIHYQENKYYTIISCNGCDSVSYRTEIQDFEMMQYIHEDDDYLPSTTTLIYPQTLRYHTGHLDLKLLPEKIKLVYEDAIRAFAAKCYLLTAVAFRAIIEAICIDKSIKIQDFEDLKPQIDKLFQNGYITENERSRLHLIRFLGNDSIHAMAVPKEQDLIVVLSMVEHLLENLYIIDKRITSGLDTLIKDYDAFEELVDEKLSNLNNGDIVTLKGILGISARRLNEKLESFETKLIDKIKSNTYNNLCLWETRPHQDPKFPDVNFYKVLDNNNDGLPF